MSDPDREFQRQLLSTFRGEAEEHVRAISRGLIDLENTPGDEERAPIVEMVFREAHSLKGAARAVDLKEIETVCQSLEGVLARAKRREISLTADSLDVLHGAMDEVERLLQATHGKPDGAGSGKTADLLGGLAAVTGGLRPVGEPMRPDAASVPAGTGAEKSAVDESVRVSAGQLDRLLLQVEELVPVGMAAAHRTTELRELGRDLSEWKREWAKVQSDAHSLTKKVPASQRLFDFLSWSDEFTGRFGKKLAVLSQSTERDQRSLGAMVDSLLCDTKTLLLRPFSTLTEAFPKLVRDLCRAQGKEATLRVRGADTKIDRRILQEIKDPLVHLLRNGIDHGIEKPEERARANKPPHGALVMAIEQKSADWVEIAICDDGAGVDPRRVRETVVKSGLVTAEAAQAMGDSEILDFIFQSGVSTSPIVTEISGRGLGMAIVREKVERLGGDVTLENRVGAGTTFRLLLPLTVSMIRGILIRLGEQRFIIPVPFVEKVAAVSRDSVQTVKNQATVLLGGQIVSFIRLHEVLGLPADRPADGGLERLLLVVLAASERRIAFQVDEIIGEQEALVKGLGPQLVRMRNFGGAAVLGTGKLVPILNVPDLFKSAVRTGPRSSPAQPVAEAAAPHRRSILVVDDSITARTLLKNILEAAGYLVRTAVDGAEAFAALREMEFDLVVSDVEMPQMNGFDLTARVRADRKLADLPVILVTALESRRDRERGIDVGANAYIVKSSFEQSNLLDIVRRYV